MKWKSCFTSLTILLLAPVFAGRVRAQENAAEGSNPGPPKFLNMIHQELKPGRIGAYDELEASIARIYNREGIPAFWVALESMTGPAEVLYLNLFDSSEEMASAMSALSSGVAAHPDLAQMQDRLLQENISNATTVLGVRRDDMGFRANTIDFSKMRVLRLSTVFAHPGYERAFMETEWSMSEASEKVHAPSAWAVYEVVAGLPEPAFVIVTPMKSLQEVDDLIETSQELRQNQGGVLQQHLQELARIAFGTSDTRLFSVGQKISHVSKKFASGDADFWLPATTPAPSAIGGKNEKAPPKNTNAPAPKP